MNPEFARILEPRCVGHELNQLWSHWCLVKDWNEKINLTSIESDRDAAWLHYRDSLSVVDYLPTGPVVDMGSGAGFPGIPLAVVCPERSFCLVEPRRKRASFLRVVVGKLQLSNVEIFHGRSTDKVPRLFSALVTRATFSQPSDLHYCLPWLSDEGILVAFRSGDAATLSLADRSISYHLNGHKRRLDFITRNSMEKEA